MRLRNDFYVVEISRKRVNGQLRAQPMNDNAWNFCHIKGTKTLSGHDLKTVRLLGYEVRYTDWAGGEK